MRFIRIKVNEVQFKCNVAGYHKSPKPSVTTCVVIETLSLLETVARNNYSLKTNINSKQTYANSQLIHLKTDTAVNKKNKYIFYYVFTCLISFIIYMTTVFNLPTLFTIYRASLVIVALLLSILRHHRLHLNKRVLIF